jgi:hypothetical protein
LTVSLPLRNLELAQAQQRNAKTEEQVGNHNKRENSRLG